MFARFVANISHISQKSPIRISMQLALCAIGNALVDIIVSVKDDFLKTHAVIKGGMTLVDDARSVALYDAIGMAGGNPIMSSGGSAANTLAGFASLGGTCAFLGKTGRDQFGEAFAHDLHGQMVHFTTLPSKNLATGRCLVLVTPDAQRSMNTFLGAATEFSPDDVDATVVRAASVTYLEGYLFDKPMAQAAFRKAAEIAHEAGKKLALTLSDGFCVSRHKDAFLDLVANDVDILFANEEELKSLYGAEDFDDALNAVRVHTDIAVVTRGSRGSVIVAGDETYRVAAQPVPQVVDTTGAGDQYAAGFLFGLTQDKGLAESGRIGALAAAEVIGHYGPRPQKKLRELLSK
jgi:sugar/nucleoside kinase (ribokinase family)